MSAMVEVLAAAAEAVGSVDATLAAGPRARICDGDGGDICGWDEGGSRDMRGLVDHDDEGFGARAQSHQ